MSKYRSDDAERLAALFKGLAHPQRLRIFLELCACCRPGTRWDAGSAAARRYAGELGEGLGLAASTVSHHLKELRQAGLMRVERCGQRIECWVDQDAVRELTEFFGGRAAGAGGRHGKRQG